MTPPHTPSRIRVTTAPTRRLLRSALGLVVATSTALLTLGLSAPAAQADTAPAAALPATVSADPLPTWQVSGVVWSQVTVGTTVYATGSFTKARPPGAKAGASTEITVGNLIAYDITTGDRIASFDHTLNAQGLAVAASPDGRRVYVGGDFTTVDGRSRSHLAAFDTRTGALVGSFAPSVNGQVKALAATATTLYAGGAFTGAGESGTARRKNLASFSTANGAVSTGFAPSADDGAVWSMVLTPDGSKLVVGGQFSTLGGLTVNGMGAVDPVTGAGRTWAANAVIMDSGKGAIDALTTDGTYVYGGGFAFGTGGRFEGSFALDPADGSIRWMVDCQGDTYDVEPVGGVVYTVSHSHNCTMIDQFPDTSPRSRWQHAGAYTAVPTSTNDGPDAYGWNYKGQPAPTMLHWFPNLGIGQATGQYQAAWSVTSGAGYVALGGEFPTVEGKAQQGLTRYALRGTKVTDKVGPKYDDTVPVRTAAPPTTAVSVAPGSVRVSFGAAWDEDNTRLTYALYRDRGTAAEKLVKTLTADSSFYDLPTQAVTDTGVPGGQHTYRVVVTDPYGNALLSPVSEPVTADSSTGVYASQVLLDGADHFWRLGETSTTTAYDVSGAADGTAGAGVTRGATGALSGDPSTASTFNGTATGSIGAGSSATAGPAGFTLEGWFSTTSTAGGKILGLGSAKTGSSTSSDRQVYVGPTGKVTFGVLSGSARTVTSPTAYNDGRWHQFTASLGADGMALYLDGRLVGRDRNVTSASTLAGYWRIGGDAVSSSWPNRPTSGYLAGTVDEVATYPLVLTPTQVGDHFVKSGRTSAAPAAAPTDRYGAAVFAASPSLQWRLGESAGRVAVDSSASDNRGAYLGSPAYGRAGALSTSTDKSVTFGSSSAGVASASNFVYDTSYAEELWFKTSSTKGGKLIGFGRAQTGLSTTVDRNLTMTDAGKVRFAALNGTARVAVTSAKAYNDNRWHYAVASQDPQGMALYVDGLSVGANTVNATSAAVGYWRVGYDKVWSGSTSAAFAGQIDEVAVYPRSLGLAEIKNRYRLGGGKVANTAPRSSFTFDARSLDVAFSGTTSTDVDGTVTGYAWSWGDGTTSTGAQADHRFAKAGSYPVTLTVTDDQGARTAASQTIAVTNGLPTAAFTATAQQRTVSVDGSSSRDDDGTVTGWAWDFGDGGTATGANATHTYAADGTYPVTLRVTDDAGGVSTAGTQTVTVQKTKDPVARIAAATTGVRVAFDGSGSDDPDGTVTAYAWDFGDRTGSAALRPEHVYGRAGTYTVTLTVTDDKGATGTTTSSVTVADALPRAAFTSSGDALDQSFDAGTSSDADGTVTGWAWDFGDGATATTAEASHTFAAPGTYRVRLTVTDDLGGSGSTGVDVVVRAANVRPTAAFGSSSADLVGSFDASASSDSDGAVASYAWDFGDGSTGTGVSAQHTYAADGSYPVTLVVTDDRGGTGTKTGTVVISGLLAKDGFGRTATGTWGTADRGGAWVLSGGAASFATTGSAGTMTAASGSQPTARLGVSSTDTDLQVGFAIDTASTGGGQFVRALVRGDQTDGYGVRLWVNKDGVLTSYLTRVVGGTETDVAGPKVLGGTVTPGTTYRIRVQAVGAGDTTLRAKVWASTATEPSGWQLSTTDSTASLQRPGGVALRSYLSGSATNGPMTVSFSDLTVRPTGS